MSYVDISRADKWYFSRTWEEWLNLSLPHLISERENKMTD